MSGGGMPELGSKISLISKADIRYEGRLYTVDPQECTIALSSVRSFGTEDRETQFQIAPQSQIYDYILFRGSDIKDIRVVNNNLPHPNDPAIMQVHMPNGQHLMPHFPMANMSAPHAPPMGGGGSGYPFGLGNSAGLGNLTGGSSSAGNAPQSLAPGSNAPGSFMHMGGNQQQQQQQVQQQKTQQQQKQPSESNHQQQEHEQQQAQEQHLLTILNQEQLPKQQQQQQLPKQQQKQPKQEQREKQQPKVTANKAAIKPPPAASVTPSRNAANMSFSVAVSGILGIAPPKQRPKADGQVSVIDMLAGASRSTTPISLISRKSPTDLVNQQQQQQIQQHGGGSGRDAAHKRQSHQQRGGGGGGLQHNNNQQQRNHNDYNNYNHPHQQNNRDRRDSGRGGVSGGGGNMDGNQYNNYNQRNNHPGAQNRGWNIHRAGPQNPNNMMRSRNPNTRGRIQSHQGYRPMGGGGPGLTGTQNKPRTGKNTIKFEQDFDFEQANNKFEELRSQLAKLKVGDEAKSSEQLDTPAATTNSQMNGEVDKKDDSGNETGAGEHEPEDEEIHVGYDKAKSFFDNISCEAAQDRSKNKKNDWRQERKLNSETFGVSSTRRGSGYRGRGNYYNRNAGGGGNYIGNNGGIGGGGGYNRHYRGGNNNNYRNRSNNRNNLPSNNPNNNANNLNQNGGSAAAALKQAQQHLHPLALKDDEASETTTSTTTTTTKTTTLQENSTQPQVAAVGQ